MRRKTLRADARADPARHSPFAAPAPGQSAREPAPARSSRGRAVAMRPREGALIAGLILAGTGTLLVALLSQHHAPQPAPGAFGSTPTATAAPSPGGTPANPAAPAAPVVSMTASAPVGIVIPAIGVRSPVGSVGLNPDGTIEVPHPGPHYDEAAWYRYSPTPGQLGPAVIEGHVDSAKSGPSVFFRLGALHPGDVIDIARADASVAMFRVSAVRSYPKDDFPTAAVYGNTDAADLRLITCGGSFDRATGHYRANIIVFASLIGSLPEAGRA